MQPDLVLDEQLPEQDFLRLCRGLGCRPHALSSGYLVVSVKPRFLPLFRGCQTATYQPSAATQPQRLRAEIVWRRPRIVARPS